MDVLQQLRIANRERVTCFGHTIEDWSLSDWGNALSGETGELCNVITKNSPWRYDTRGGK